MKATQIQNWRDFMRGLHSIATVARWAFRMADSPNIRSYNRQKYISLLLVIIFNLLQPGVVNYLFAGIINGDVEKVCYAIGTLALLFTLVRIGLFIHWRAHEYLSGPSLHNIQRRITEKFLEKSPHQHKVLKGLNHESMAKAKTRLFEIYIHHIPEAVDVITRILIAYVLLWCILPSAGALMTIFIVTYLCWSLYLSYRAAKVCPPIEEEFTAFERYMAARWKFAERVIVSSKEDDELERLEHRWDGIIRKDRGFWFWHLRQAVLRDGLSSLFEIIIIAYGAYLALRGHWESIGPLYPLYAWTSIIVSNIWRIGSIQRTIMGYVPSLQVMMNTLEVPPDVNNTQSARDLNSSGPLALSFHNVSYGYQSGEEKRNTIHDVSLTVAKGERVALIGPSGSGKSTLHYLAQRFMDPQSGNICVNGTDIKNITLRSWRQAIAYIPQRAQIFDGTVRENLLYALPWNAQHEWSDERLLTLMNVLAIDFGNRPPDENPLDIIVGREGVQLSGGQAQRLAIGAAVIKKPRLILIDEATSHLDSTTEKAVLEGLNELLSGISTLVIAHRLSTVATADKIIVLADGCIEACAESFTTLHEVSPTFRRLAKDQNLSI